MRKLIFEDEEEFNNFWFTCGIGDKTQTEYKHIFARAKEHGYIRRSPAEEAEEMYQEKCQEHRLTRLEVKQHEVIQYLKERQR